MVAASLTDPELLARWLGIVVIDLTLAGDNALVIALAVRTLPPRQQLWGRVGGTFGAVALRLVLIAVVSQLLRISFLQAVGGLALIWIALKLVRQSAGDDHGKVRQGTSVSERFRRCSSGRHPDRRCCSGESSGRFAWHLSRPRSAGRTTKPKPPSRSWS